MNATFREAVRTTVLLCTAIWLVLAPGIAHGHGGGEPQLTNAAAGPYRLFVWTEPEPWRAGEVHLSLIVTLPPSTGATADDSSLSNQPDKPVTDVAVEVELTPVNRPDQAIAVIAEQQDMLNNVYFEADIELPDAGEWQATIRLDGPQGVGSASFRTTVLAPRSISWTSAILAGLLLAALLGTITLWSRRRQAGRTGPQARLPSRPLRRGTDGNVQKAA